MQVTINLNDQATCKLTEHGRAVALDYLNRFGPAGSYKTLEQFNPKWQDGTIRLSLWELMHMLGPHVYMGKPALVELCQITIEAS